MPYNAEISRANPGCFLFMLDQSGSMSELLSLPGEPPISRAQALADAINRLISDLVLHSTQGVTVLDRFHLGVILYNGNEATVAPSFGGLKALSEVAANPLKVESRTLEASDGAGGIVQRTIHFPTYFEPRAGGGTPMCSALALAHSLLEPWCAAHPDSHPPVVVNLTDGEATDGDPLAALRHLQSCGTRDGQTLVFNALLSNGTGGRTAYPSSSEGFPPGPVRSLVEGSSVLPQVMLDRARGRHELALPEGARGVVIQANLLDVIKLLDIGTRPPL